MKDKKGFTLIEMLSVVVILGMIFMFILPNINVLFTMGNKTETELIEERVLKAAKEYVNNIDVEFYTKLYKEGDTNYIYKSDLIDAGLITNEEMSKLNTFAGVKGELLENDRIRYTVEYINASNNEYTNEELYLMMQNLTKDVQQIKNQGGSNVGGTNMSLLSVYPVGSVYVSTVDTSPSELFGGTWVTFGSGKTLVGVDPSQTEFASVELTGGEKEHILTINEMPSHGHTSYYYNSSGTLSWGYNYSNGNGKETSSTTPSTSGIGLTGGSEAHNNLQPYITVYMWKRTA